MGAIKWYVNSPLQSQGVDMMAFMYSNDGHVSYARNASLLLEKDYWYLKEELKVDITMNDDLYEVVIPEGYLTDGATVPRILWSICPKWDQSHKAVILHDYLCEYGVIRKNGEMVKIDRERIDLLFLEAMRFEGVSQIKHSMMYAAVRLHVNINGHKYAKVNRLKLQLEDEIRVNLKEKYYN